MTPRRQRCKATPLGAPRPPDPPRHKRGAGKIATLAGDASARHAKPLTSARRPTCAPPALGAGPRSSRPSSPPLRSVCPCAPKQRGPQGCQTRGRAAPAVWSRAAVAGARQLLPPRAAPPPSRRPASRASAAVSPAPRAPRPRHRLGVRTGLKGPDVCGCPSPAPAPSPTPPPRPATHALAASQPPPRLQLISILTVTVAAGGAPRTRRGGGRQSGRGAGGGMGGRAEPPSAWGSSSFLFLSFFSLCLLQDLKGQPRPRRGARRPPFLRSPDALCGPAGPSRTRSTGSRPPGIFRSTPGPGQRGGGAWLGGPGARLFLQSPIVGVGEEIKELSSCFSNRKS